VLSPVRPTQRSGGLEELRAELGTAAVFPLEGLAEEAPPG